MLPMPNLLWEADGTLTDEASHELLLLYGCADAALEVAFVEHDLCLWSDIVCKCVYRTYTRDMKVTVMVLSSTCANRH